MASPEKDDEKQQNDKYRDWLIWFDEHLKSFVFINKIAKVISDSIFAFFNAVLVFLNNIKLLVHLTPLGLILAGTITGLYNFLKIWSDPNSTWKEKFFKTLPAMVVIGIITTAAFIGIPLVSGILFSIYVFDLTGYAGFKLGTAIKQAYEENKKDSEISPDTKRKLANYFIKFLISFLFLSAVAIYSFFPTAAMSIGITMIGLSLAALAYKSVNMTLKHYTRNESTDDIELQKMEKETLLSEDHHSNFSEQDQNPIKNNIENQPKNQRPNELEKRLTKETNNSDSNNSEELTTVEHHTSQEIYLDPLNHQFKENQKLTPHPHPEDPNQTKNTDSKDSSNSPTHEGSR